MYIYIYICKHITGFHNFQFRGWHLVVCGDAVLLVARVSCPGQTAGCTRDRWPNRRDYPASYPQEPPMSLLYCLP